MVELKHASHGVYKIRYHMVLCIKYKKKLLCGTDKIELFLKKYTLKLEKNHVHRWGKSSMRCRMNEGNRMSQ
ncbi:MAG: hypothetical protein CHKLHMKO_00669 [Candidatus Argoarchaeum ethanivorans]|uniref:Transposase IS200-like domain-containing protein n=1 Tax=Candidatus Argoarchaeum ethanivorans TaxID=2608793 RepID=A0A811TEF7_9EURY|nr:MAG: hypothetical protein CHKLHMKO_00669 [Candidatus Argoarchaeum ethanivorans]